MTTLYADKVEMAKRWLGDRYLLAHPMNKPRAYISQASMKACLDALRRQQTASS